jgi:phosphate transport system protein
MKRTRKRVLQEPESTRELTGLIREACLIAKDCASNLYEFVQNSSKMAFLAVKDCEKELDRIERTVDEKITQAITEVTENEARELLACLKFIIDLERIGDLLWSAAKRLQSMNGELNARDRESVLTMAKIVVEMLEKIDHGFLRRDLKSAQWVLQNDSRMDLACRNLMRHQIENMDQRHSEAVTNLLFVGQAFERAGDHAKNLSEELFHLIEGRSMRHQVKRTRVSG